MNVGDRVSPGDVDSIDEAHNSVENVGGTFGFAWADVKMRREFVNHKEFMSVATGRRDRKLIEVNG
jgi:hypothetical protein